MEGICAVIQESGVALEHWSTLIQSPICSFTQGSIDTGLPSTNIASFVDSLNLLLISRLPKSAHDVWSVAD